MGNPVHTERSKLAISEAMKLRMSSSSHRKHIASKLISGNTFCGILEIPKQPGVYVIKNQVNGFVYVGAASDMRKRVRKHASYLRSKIHPNNYLQQEWNEYGANAFHVRVIQLMETDKIEILNKVETLWIKHYDSSSRLRGYNIDIESTRSKGSMAKETAEKISRSRTGMIFTEQHRINMSNARRGEKRTEEYKEGRRQAMLEMWKDESFRAKVLNGHMARKNKKEAAKNEQSD